MRLDHNRIYDSLQFRALGLPINIELSKTFCSLNSNFDIRICLQVSGDLTERVTPVPIPNTEVKPLRADGTARATLWETRSLPGLINKKPLVSKDAEGFLHWGNALLFPTGLQYILHGNAPDPERDDALL